MTREELRNSINGLVKEQLEKYHCSGGHLRYQAPSKIAFSGTKEDGKSVLIWQIGPQLGFFLSQYIDGQPDWGGLEIEIFLREDRFDYTPLLESALRQESARLEMEGEADVVRRREELRRMLGSDVTPYGAELARKVGEALSRDSLGYGHRDYCGTGLELRDGTYRYGDLWDGMMDQPLCSFSDRDSFVAWLAGQSNASLARLEEKDPFYWGNQTLNRQRLQEFVAGS